MQSNIPYGYPLHKKCKIESIAVTTSMIILINNLLLDQNDGKKNLTLRKSVSSCWFMLDDTCTIAAKTSHSFILYSIQPVYWNHPFSGCLFHLVLCRSWDIKHPYGVCVMEIYVYRTCLFSYVVRWGRYITSKSYFHSLLSLWW